MNEFQGKLIFIGGSPRSGTTLLRKILNLHPDVCAGPEFCLIPAIMTFWEDANSRVRSGQISAYVNEEEVDRIAKHLFYQLINPYFEKSNKKHLAEKTPDNILYFDKLHYLFPEAYLVHVIRDGRDVICSLLQVADRYRKASEDIPVHINGVEKCAATWQEYVMAPRRDAELFNSSHFQKKYVEVRYENLVIEPEPTIRHLCDRLGVEFSEVMLSPQDMKMNTKNKLPWFTKKMNAAISTESYHRYKKDLSLIQKLFIARNAQDALECYGYAMNKRWVFEGFDKSFIKHPVQDIKDISYSLLNFIKKLYKSLN